MNGIEAFFLEGAASWQDVVLSIGSILFTIALLPTLRDKKASLPVTTSLLTASVLSSYLIVYISLGLWFAAICGCSVALAWWLILLFRRIRNPPVGFDPLPAP